MQCIATLYQNAAIAHKAFLQACRAMPSERGCKCGASLKHALITDLKLVPAATKKRLASIIGKYLS
jgi:5'-methylthioadenosine phosphorylase